MTLREIQESDAELLVRWRNQNARWFPAGNPLTVAGHLGWYHRSYLADPSQNMYMILLDGRAIGVTGVTIRNGEGQVERMILGDKSFARSGIMSQAVRQLLNAYGLKRYWGRVMPGNEASIRFHEKIGFSVIGTHGGAVTDIYGNSGELVVIERVT